MRNGYSFWIGVWKAVKNNLWIWTPALLAFLASVPVKYAPIASVITYVLKNAYEYNKGSK